MIPRRPSAYCMRKLEMLTVDTRRGRVYRDGVELVSPGPRKKVSMRDENGRSVNFYRYHVVWWKKTGHWPRLELDHKNEDTRDDRFSNLQEMTHSANCLKSKRSGLPLGVDKKRSHYRVRVYRENKQFHVGYFDTLKEATRELSRRS